MASTRQSTGSEPPPLQMYPSVNLDESFDDPFSNANRRRRFDTGADNDTGNSDHPASYAVRRGSNGTTISGTPSMYSASVGGNTHASRRSSGAGFAIQDPYANSARQPSPPRFSEGASFVEQQQQALDRARANAANRRNSPTNSSSNSNRHNQMPVVNTPSFQSNSGGGGDDHDPILEQLRKERFAEIVALQQNLYRKAVDPAPEPRSRSPPSVRAPAPPATSFSSQQPPSSVSPRGSRRHSESPFLGVNMEIPVQNRAGPQTNDDRIKAEARGLSSAVNQRRLEGSQHTQGTTMTTEERIKAEARGLSTAVNQRRLGESQHTQGTTMTQDDRIKAEARGLSSAVNQRRLGESSHTHGTTMTNDDRIKAEAMGLSTAVNQRRMDESQNTFGTTMTNDDRIKAEAMGLSTAIGQRRLEDSFQSYTTRGSANTMSQERMAETSVGPNTKTDEQIKNEARGLTMAVNQRRLEDSFHGSVHTSMTSQQQKTDDQIKAEARGLKTAVNQRRLNESMHSTGGGTTRTNNNVMSDEQIKNEARGLATEVGQRREAASVGGTSVGGTSTVRSTAAQKSDDQIKAEARGLASAVNQRRQEGSVAPSMRSSHGDDQIVKDEARSLAGGTVAGAVSVKTDAAIKAEARGLATEVGNRREAASVAASQKSSQQAEDERIKDEARSLTSTVRAQRLAASFSSMQYSHDREKNSPPPPAVGAFGVGGAEDTAMIAETATLEESAPEENKSASFSKIETADVEGGGGGNDTADGADAKDERDKGHLLEQRRNLIFLVGFLAVVILILTIVAGVCGSGGCGGGDGGGGSGVGSSSIFNNNGAQEASPAIYWQYQGAVMAKFGVHYFDGMGEKPANASSLSARHNALDWILTDNTTNIQDPNFIQRFVLALFYFQTTQSSDWKECDGNNGVNVSAACFSNSTESWLSLGDECSWIGIKCDNATREVNELTVDSMGIQGNIPTELAALTELAVLQLEKNQLFGTVPTEISTITSLKRLNMSSNSLEGSLPPDFARLTGLEAVDFSQNRMYGDIPDLAALSSLYHFDVSGNDFYGSMPPSFCDLVQNFEKINNSNETLVVRADCYMPAGRFPKLYCEEGCCTECCFHGLDHCFAW